MGIKGKIKKALHDNPIAESRREKMRKELYNNDFTLLAPNCMAGILLHDLGLRFLTPTVNLMMTQTDFLVFALHLDEYLQGELSFFEDPDESCPCAHLKYNDLPEITVFFTHYKSAEEAEQKWRERTERINRDNLFVFIEERDGITRSDLEKLKQIPARGVLAFTCNDYPDLPYCVFIRKYHKNQEVGNILAKNILDDSREYEHYFDFVKWFNEADGGVFDVGRFKK